LELAAWKLQGVFTIVAAWIWLAGMAFLVVSTIGFSLADFIDDLKKREFVGPVLMIGFIVLAFWGAGMLGPRWLDYESAQELAAGMKNLGSPDLGYMSRAFWGYPSRQYTFLALPSLVMALGCFLIYFKDSRIGNALRLGLASGFLGAMYTPALAAAALIAATLALKAIGAGQGKTPEDRCARWASAFLDLGICLYISAVTCLSALLMQNSLTVGTTKADFLSKTLIALIQEKPYGIFRFLTPLALAYIALSLAGILTIYDLYISLWVCSVVAMALMMKGVNDNSFVSIQRASVTVPVLAAAIGYHVTVAAKSLSGFSIFKIPLLKRAFLGTACLMVAIPIAINVAKPVLPPNISQVYGLLHTTIALEAKKAIKEEGLDPSKLTMLYYVDGITNLHDYLVYLIPGVTVIVAEDGQFKKEYDKSGDLIIAALAPAAVPQEMIGLYGPTSKTSFDVLDQSYVFEMAVVSNP
jgi:hypothetical protein